MIRLFRFTACTLPLVFGACDRSPPGATDRQAGKLQTRVAERPAEPAGSAAAASELAGGLSEPESPLTAAAAEAGRFAERDPAAGLAWARGLENPEERAKALEELAWSCATTDLATALQAAVELPAGENRQRLLSHLMAAWTEQDSAAALEWAKGCADPGDRDEALGGWATAMGERAPAEAALLASGEIRPGAVQNRVVVAIVQRWAQRDFPATRAWVDAFPEGPLKEDARRELQAAKK